MRARGRLRSRSLIADRMSRPGAQSRSGRSIGCGAGDAPRFAAPHPLRQVTDPVFSMSKAERKLSVRLRHAESPSRAGADVRLGADFVEKLGSGSKQRHKGHRLEKVLLLARPEGALYVGSPRRDRSIFSRASSWTTPEALPSSISTKSAYLGCSTRSIRILKADAGCRAARFALVISQAY